MRLATFDVYHRLSNYAIRKRRETKSKGYRNILLQTFLQNSAKNSRFLKLTELISPPPEIKTSEYVDFAGRLYVPQISMCIEIARN